MQVIRKMKHNGSTWVPAENSKIDLTKKLGSSVSAISLKKSTISLDKTLVNLSKSSGINMQGHIAKVAVDIDTSGSMSWMYNNGDLQKAINRLLPLALRFDDNGELDVWAFSNFYQSIEPMTINNFEGYVRNCMMVKNLEFGGTNYSPVLQDNQRVYCGNNGTRIPAFVIFITDGDNFDKYKTNEVITELSKHDVFIQFVGIGSARFDYLESLDNLAGRECDNTGFIKVTDFDSLSDDELYEELLKQYVEWLHVKGFH